MQQQVQLEGVERQLGGQGAVDMFVGFVCVMGGEGDGCAVGRTTICLHG